MTRRGSSGDWGDARDNNGRSGRGGPPAEQRRRDDGRGHARLSGPQVAAALREAQHLQHEGQLDDAIQLCEELMDSGIDRADVRYFLGWLYQEADRWEEAANQFDALLSDPDYALSCFYALGQCSRAQGDIESAARYFDEAVDRVNLDALSRDESDQLIQLCQEAAEAHREMSDMEGAETVFTALLGFLRSQGWQDQVVEVERLMRETLGTAPPPRRRKATNKPSGRAIPQRPTGTPRGQTGGFFPLAGGLGASGLGAPAVGGAADLLSSPPGLGAIGAGGMGSSPGAFGASYGGSGMPPGGAGNLAGAGAYYSSTIAPAAPGDQLALLLQNLSGLNGVRSALSALPEPQRAQVAQAVRSIENYVAHGLLTAAVEECLKVMDVAPQYLDIHLMLAEIYVRQGKLEAAIAKYAVLVDTYLTHGRTDDAISTYRRILQLDPNNLTYRTKLTELLNRQGRLDEVLAERMTTADTYLRLGYADRAIQEYEQALLASPNHVPARLNYARALMKAGRAQQAIGEYQRILQVDPGNVLALCQWQIGLATGVGMAPGLSMSLPGATGATRATTMEALTRLIHTLRMERGRGYEDVVREYHQALDSNPTNLDLRYALGTVHLAASRQAEAVTAFQQAAAGQGLEVLARFGAGQACLLSGDMSGATQAVRELEEAAGLARRSPPEPAVWAARPRFEGEDVLAPEIEVSQLLAKAYQLSGQINKMPPGMALGSVSGSQPRAYNDEVYRELAAISARVGDPQAAQQEYAQLARHYRANRQTENALVVLKEMARVAPDDPGVHGDLAEIQISRGMLDEGTAELRALAGIHTRRGQLREAAAVYLRMAEVAWGTGERDDALNMLRQGMQLATGDITLCQQFVQYCLEVGRNAEAAEQQEVVARHYFSARMTKEAVAALQQLIGMAPQNYDAYDLLGQTYYSVGEYEQAARVYRNLAKVNPASQTARQRLQELQTVRSQMR
ncbi:MAG: tetratricopeptide repeat protein [Ktedonobacterales bacterium]